MLKLTIVIALLTLVVIFILQNTTTVAIDFLFWSLESPRALVFFLLYIAGLGSGVLITLYLQRKKSRRMV